MTEKRKKYLCTGLILLNLAFIWGNSLINADLSGSLSQWVRDMLGTVAGEMPGQSDGVLRKLAHFLEFCSLGFLLSWQLAMRKEKIRALVLPSAVLGCLAACVDEMLQHFSPGRAPRLTDVGIDTAGVLVGIGIFCLGYTLMKKNNNLHFGGKRQ